MYHRLTKLRAAACAGLALLLLPITAKAETFSTLYQFQGGTDGANPVSAILNASGIFYGTTIGGGSQSAGTVVQLLPPATTGAWSDKVLHSFAADGTQAYGTLFAYKTSVLGTTFSSSLSGNAGRAYQLKPMVTPVGSWKEILLHGFGAAGDGWGPEAGLIKQGSLYYGTTLAGGVAGCKGYTNGADGCGTVFQLKAPAVAGGAWTEQVLYSFKGGNDGAIASSSLLFAKKALFGVTTIGGTGNCQLPNTSGGCGTVYSVTPQGVKTAIYSFTGGTDGAFPIGKLIFVQGALFGTTSAGGGTGCGGSGCGIIFRLKPPLVAGGPWREKIMYAFGGGTDGAGPIAGLLNIPPTGTGGAPGNLYGTTSLGGGSGCGGGGCGTVFKFPLVGTGAGKESVVHAFQGAGDGAFPVGDLINSGGPLGTTQFGGTSACPGGRVAAGYQGCGTVFQITN